jgi:hypothetical protein
VIYAVYFAQSTHPHPCGEVPPYRDQWAAMHRSARKLGLKVWHLTDRSSESWGDETFRSDVDPDTIVYSRDVAWAQFIRQLPDGEQACMIEPDCIMLKKIPPTNRDMVLLHRPHKVPAGWFKLGTRKAAPFFDAVAEEYSSMTPEEHVWHGDITAIMNLIGTKGGERGWKVPATVKGVQIESRPCALYGGEKKANAFFHQYKGSSKSKMPL